LLARWRLAAHFSEELRFLVSLGWADKPAEKHGWLIWCERKILF
jgi:hypothetical protein